MESTSLNLEFKTKLNTEIRQELQQQRHYPIFGDSLQLITGSSHCNMKMKEITRNRSFHQLYFNSLNTNDITNHNNEHDDEDDDEDAIEETDLKSNEINLDGSSSLASLTAKLKLKLSKYRNELREYNNTTKDLEDRYIKMTLELNDMQQKHEQFVTINHNCSNSVASDFPDIPVIPVIPVMEDVTSAGSEYSLKRKHTQVFDRTNSILHIALKESNGKPLTNSRNYDKIDDEESSRYIDKKSRKPNSFHSFSINKKYVCHSKPHLMGENKENEMLDFDDDDDGDEYSICDADLRSSYKSSKSIMGNRNQKSDNNNNKQQQLKDIDRLQTAIASLQNEKKKFQNIIVRQQSCLDDYYSRCVKAHEIMHTQRIEIDKLHSNNQQLEEEITSGIERLRHKLETKLLELAQLPQMLHDERANHDRTRKENAMLHDRIRATQMEVHQLKDKLEEVNKKKLSTLAKLKVAERDLKIFKNYNSALKQEKQRLNNELRKLREQMDSLENGNKRILNRQREQSEKHRRELQKRVFELELKLSRSQKSTSSLLQERDNIITELQSQLNTLVHNFEISQKHIRVLRRHIYAMSNVGNGNGIGGAGSSTTTTNNNNNNNNNRGQQQQQKQYQLNGNHRVYRTFSQGT